MPEYVVKVKSPEVLSGFELVMLEGRVKNFFVNTNTEIEPDETIVKAEFA